MRELTARSNNIQKKKIIQFILVIAIWIIMIGCRFDMTRRSIFENYSENLVCSIIYADLTGMEIDQSEYGIGPLQYPDTREPYDVAALFQDTATFYGERMAEEELIYGSYRSQLGFQGKIVHAITSIYPSPKVYWLIRLMNIGCFEAILLGICIQIKKKYGNLYALTFLLTSIISPWITVFVPNLYWVEFLWFIPMLLGLLCVNYPEKRGLFYILNAAALCIKSMCGYEYVTTIMISSISFLGTEWINNKDKRNKTFKMICGMGISCLIGFFAAYGLHSYYYGNHDILSGAKNLFYDTVLRRTWGDSSNYDAAYAVSLDASALEVVSKYLWHNIAGKVTLFILILSIVSLLAEKYYFQGKVKLQTSALAIQFLSSVSWFVLAKEHSYVHTPLNFVMWHLGFMQTAIWIICWFLYRHKDMWVDGKQDESI